MAIFALIPAVALVAYCIVQTYLDFRRKSYVMAVWGAAVVLFIAFFVLRIIVQMPATR